LSSDLEDSKRGGGESREIVLWIVVARERTKPNTSTAKTGKGSSRVETKGSVERKKGKKGNRTGTDVYGGYRRRENQPPNEARIKLETGRKSRIL